MHNLKLWFDRALSRGIGRQLAIMSVILFICYGISCVLLSRSNEWQMFCEEYDGICNKYLLPLYLLIDQNAFNSIYFEHGSSVDYHIVIASGITYLLGLVFFGGAIIAILSDFIKRRVDNYENGRTFYYKNGHYIIMGYDDIVPSIISHIQKVDTNANILILTSTTSLMILEKLKESSVNINLDNVVVNNGHRISKVYYKDTHLESAKQIFIAGDRTKPQHDALNIECVENICEYLTRNFENTHTVERITCTFENLDTYVSFCTTDIFSELTNKLNIAFVPYNKYVCWANQVFVRRQYFSQSSDQMESYPLLCGNGIEPDDDVFVHLVFVGTSTFAISFAREAAHLFHFSNFVKKQCRTRITFIDKNMDVEMHEIMTRYRHLFEVQSYYYEDYSDDNIKTFQPNNSRLNNKLEHTDFLDVEFEFIKGDIFSKSIQDLLCEWQKDTKRYLNLFVAMTKQSDNFAIAMNLPDELYENQVHDGWSTPIFIRQDNADNFVSRLRLESQKRPLGNKAIYWYKENGILQKRERHGKYSNIYPFGMNDTAFYSDELAIRRAKLVNYLYYTMKDGHFSPLTVLATQSANTIWREANVFWKKLTVAEKWSNLYFAYEVDYKMISLRKMRGLTMNDSSMDYNPLNDTEKEFIGNIEHNRWNVEKLLMGYRKPLPSEDKYQASSKEEAEKLKNNKNLFIHAQIRPFNNLSEDMQQLDKELAAYIPWIIQTTK